MPRSLVLLAGSMVLIGLSSPLFPVLAQQKSVANCRQEWRANRSAFEANKITEKAFLASCRERNAAAKQDAATNAPTTPGQEAGTEKTIKACQEEWRTKRAANEISLTEKAYVEQCRAGNAPASPSTTATPAPASVPMTTVPSAPAAGTALPRTNQYKTEAEAKGRCPSDKVVWIDLDSKMYYSSGQAAYGKTKTGAYMCEKDVK